MTQAGPMGLKAMGKRRSCSTVLWVVLYISLELLEAILPTGGEGLPECKANMNESRAEKHEEDPDHEVRSPRSSCT